MENSAPKSSKKGMYASLTGTVLVALCCFTPILVVLLGAIGLSTVTLYLDFVLIPALAIMIILSIISYLRWRKSVKNR